MVLKSMMGTYFTVCPKVSLSDIFFVTNPDRNMSAYNKINRKHVDFLICEAETMKPRFAIELDDKSHNRQDRIERDEFVEELFETTSLPLVRIPVRQTYNTGELGVLFREAMAQKPKIPAGQPFTVPVTGPMGEPLGNPMGELVEPRIRPTIPLPERTTTSLPERPTFPLPEPARPAQFSSAGVEGKSAASAGSVSGSKGPATGTTINIAPFCPKCGQQMALRTAENGANKGKKFWGCVNYPKCTMIIRIE
jgi:hypothetical protein